MSTRKKVITVKVIIKNIEEQIPRWDSFCGLETTIWEQLNAGIEVVMKGKFAQLPKLAKKYIKEVT